MKPIHGAIDSIKILHVDDDDSQLCMMSDLLKSFDPNIIIESVSNPLDVSKILQNRSYDCLITDYQMPLMNGIELSKKIRQKSNIPIILYTGQGSEEVAERAFSAGINDYFRKELFPQHYQVLAKKIRELVEKRWIEQLYTSVVEEARDAICISLNDKLVFANKSFLNLLEVSSLTNILGRKLHSILGINRKLFTNEVAFINLAEKKYTSTEIEIGSSKLTTVEMSLSRISYLGNKGVLCILNDITDRKEFETKLKKSEAKYRSLLETAPDGIMTVNNRGTVTWINPAYSNITGFTEEEIVGKRVWSIDTVRSPDVMMFLRLFYDQIRGKEIPPVEFQWISKEGKMGWGEGRASLFKVDKSNSEVLLIIRDITDRKELEDNLRKYSKDMEYLANERAKKLLESEKMTSAGALASTVAHDLRGPLSVILNAVYLAEKNPEQSSSQIHMIKKSVDVAVQMLDEMQGNITTGILKIEEVGIKEFILNTLSETPVPPRIKLDVNLVEYELLIDKSKMRRVIENLIRNAVDAMAKKGTINIKNRIHNKSMEIIIKDSGEGIPENIQKHLFQPFFTTKTKGTGLGLYYCKNTIEAHNGTIKVKSKKGKGTTFSLIIPLPGEKDVDISPELVSQVNPSIFTRVSN